jgi:hypothetical protein
LGRDSFCLIWVCRYWSAIFLNFKKKACGKAEADQKIIINSRHYKVDGEVGRFEFSTHSVVNKNAETQFNTAVQIFPVLKAREFYRTIGFKELAFIYGNTENSFRKTIALINRIRYQEENGLHDLSLFVEFYGA